MKNSGYISRRRRTFRFVSQIQGGDHRQAATATTREKLEVVGDASQQGKMLGVELWKEQVQVGSRG
jgi:hypothetical protein